MARIHGRGDGGEMLPHISEGKLNYNSEATRIFKQILGYITVHDHQKSFSIHLQNDASGDRTLFHAFIHPNKVRTNQRYSVFEGFSNTRRTQTMPTTA